MFLWLGFALAAFVTVFHCLVKPDSVLLFLLMLPFTFVLALLFFIVLLFVISLFYPQSRKAKRDDPLCRFLAYYTMDAILRVFRFRIRGIGLEKLPKEPFVLVCNHLSRFDPMVTTVLMKKSPLAFISKKENMRIPIAGNITHRIGYLALDRENPLRAMRTMRAAAKMVSEEGYVMGIYPEGTRSRSGELLEFKEGAFFMAKKAAAPIAVCAIRGTNQYKGRFPFRSTEVTFEVLSVIPVDEVKAKKADELSACCREKILCHLEKGNA